MRSPSDSPPRPKPARPKPPRDEPRYLLIGLREAAIDYRYGPPLHIEIPEGGRWVRAHGRGDCLYPPQHAGKPADVEINASSLMEAKGPPELKGGGYLRLGTANSRLGRVRVELHLPERDVWLLTSAIVDGTAPFLTLTLGKGTAGRHEVAEVSFERWLNPQNDTALAAAAEGWSARSG